MHKKEKKKLKYSNYYIIITKIEQKMNKTMNKRSTINKQQTEEEKKTKEQKRMK